MANQRQSSYRGCTQRGAYRRNTLRGLPELTAFLTIVVTCFASSSLLAQATITNSLLITVTENPANLCADTSAVLKYTVSGNGTKPGDVTPQSEVWAVPLTLNSCPAGVDQGFKAKDIVLLNVTSNSTTYSPANPSDVYAVTISDLKFCDQLATKPNWGLCAYTWNAPVRNSSTPVPNKTPVILVGSVGGGGSTTETRPVVKDIIAGDEQISFTVTTNIAATSFEVCMVEGEENKAELVAAKKCSGGNLVARTFTGTSIVLDKLKNDTVYYFTVTPSNGTLISAVQGPITPSKAYSTLEIYDGVPGGASWKCDQGRSERVSLSSIAALIAFLATAYVLSPRRRDNARRLFSALGLSVLMLASGSANADFGQWNLGVFGGPYKPNLDANTTFKTYKCLYADAVLPMLGGELDLHLGDPFGSFQLGTAIGYSWANGKALKTFNASDTNCDSQVFSDTPVALHMLQIRPRLSYVFDPYVEDFPFVPFVRAGLIGGGYVFTYQGRVDTRGQDKDINPVGIRFGWEASFGLMFLLDTIEPGVADRARGAGTYDHSYLKAEISYQSIEDFGNAGPNFSPASIVGAPANFLGTLALVIQFQ